MDELNEVFHADVPGVAAPGLTGCRVYDATDTILTDLPASVAKTRGVALAIEDDKRPSGVPPAQLDLKVGTVAFLVRNLSVADGLVNGAKVVVTRLNRFSVEVLTLKDWSAHTVPRINFEFTISGLTVARKQLPLRLAYGVTTHKAQGKTLQRVLLVLTRDMFAHGQLYVALSRVAGVRDIAFLLPPPAEDDTDSDEDATIVNVVSLALLRGHRRAVPGVRRTAEVRAATSTSLLGKTSRVQRLPIDHEADGGAEKGKRDKDSDMKNKGK